MSVQNLLTSQSKPWLKLNVDSVNEDDTSGNIISGVGTFTGLNGAGITSAPNVTYMYQVIENIAIVSFYFQATISATTFSVNLPYQAGFIPTLGNQGATTSFGQANFLGATAATSGNCILYAAGANNTQYITLFGAASTGSGAGTMCGSFCVNLSN